LIQVHSATYFDFARRLLHDSFEILTDALCFPLRQFAVLKVGCWLKVTRRSLPFYWPIAPVANAGGFHLFDVRFDIARWASRISQSITVNSHSEWWTLQTDLFINQQSNVSR